MTFKESIKICCENYAKNPKARFIGYNVGLGSRMYGTLNGVSRCRCIETPVSENLMVGLAFGMCLEGYRPVVCFERHDFLLLALDALVNHVDKMPAMGCSKLPIVVRAIVGSKYPLHPGPQHTQNYTGALSRMLKYTPVVSPNTHYGFQKAFEMAGNTQSGAVVIIEYKENYEKEITL